MERFWSKVRCGDSGCWEWTASVGSHGYGQFSLDGHPVLAHRLAYEMEVGPIPDGLTIDHLCFNRRCVNPAHLEAVTYADNNRRMKRRSDTCVHGHEYTPENTYTRPQGWRECRTCQQAREVGRWQRRKEAAPCQL